MNDANGYEIDLTNEGMHERGFHDDESDAECNHCRQLFPSTHDEAVTEALQNEHMEVL